MINNIENFISLLEDVGVEILKIRDDGLNKSLKNDNSIVTNGDIYANNRIISFLKTNFAYPILSEESLVEYKTRKNWDKFFIIDPIDGTKHYARGDGDFTINIALIKNQKSIFGIIHNPLTKETYFAQEKHGCFKFYNNITIKLTKKEITPTLIVNKSFDEKNISNLGIDFTNVLKISSSYKFCLLAENRGNYYYRNIPIHTWDIAAGDIIVSEMGYKVTDLNSNEILYNVESYDINGLIVKQNK